MKIDWAPGRMIPEFDPENDHGTAAMTAACTATEEARTMMVIIVATTETAAAAAENAMLKEILSGVWGLLSATLLMETTMTRHLLDSQPPGLKTRSICCDLRLISHGRRPRLRLPA